MKQMILFMCIAFTLAAHAQYDTTAGQMAIVKMGNSQIDFIRTDTVKSVPDGNIENTVSTTVYKQHNSTNQSYTTTGYVVKRMQDNQPVAYLDKNKKPLAKNLHVYYFFVPQKVMLNDSE